MRGSSGRTAWVGKVLRGAGLAALAVGGCASPDGGPPYFLSPSPPTFGKRDQPPAPPAGGPPRARPVDPLQAASFLAPVAGQAVRPADAVEAVEPADHPPVAVDDLVRIAVGRNPRVARATIAIDAAQGRYVQAGLYPNPDLGFAWDEIGDRTSPNGAGIMTVPRVTQTIVTGKKLSLAQAVAAREIDQATLDMLTERFTVIGLVRATFYEVYALQERHAILVELAKLAEQGVAQGKTLVENMRMARLDLIQLEVELERFRTEATAVERELPAAYRRLAAVTGDPRLPIRRVTGPFEAPPLYDMEQAREAVLAYNPEVRSARVGVERAQAAVRAAEAQPIPNVTVSGGFVRQFENRSYDGLFGLSAPIPVWNRNQGNIREARAQVGMAIQQVGRIENDLADRLAVAFRTYYAARIRAELYRREILPRAEETLKLSQEAFKGGQFEYLRVILAQRAVAEARLEYNRSLGEAWRAAGEISGLLLEEIWPGPPAKPPGPGAGPVLLPEPKKLPEPKP